MGSCRLSSFAKVLRGSFVRAISSAGMCARKQGRGVYAVRRLAIHVKKALIFREIASWAERSAFSASALSLSRPAQALLVLRPAESLSRPRRPLSRGSDPASYPAKPLVSYRTYRLLSGWNPPPLEIRTFRAHSVTRYYLPNFS